MIENVEHLITELHVKSLRNPPDVIVFKHGEVKLREARTGQEVTTGVAAQVKAGVRWEPACPI